MALHAALGGMTLSAAPLGFAASVACADGLRVRAPAAVCRACRALRFLVAADAPWLRRAGAGRAGGRCAARDHHRGSAGASPTATPVASPKAGHAGLRLPRRGAPQIRFTRLGRKKVPFFRVVVMDSKTRRDGRPLEVRP